MGNTIQVYSPDTSYPDEKYQYFLDLRQLRISVIQKGEELQVQGNFNTKMGDDQHSSGPEVVGKFGQKLLQCCAINDLIIANTVFQHANTRRATWI